MTDEATISGAPAVEVTIETAPTVAVELSAGAAVNVTLETAPTVAVTLQTVPTVEVTLETAPTVDVTIETAPTLLFVPDGKLEGYATQAELAAGLAAKSDAGHDHDGRYYTEAETYTKAETDALFTAFRAAVLDAVHPIGDIYMSIDSTNPGLKFGGEWERIEDTFLLAAGDAYAAGSTGGEATHRLTKAESGLPGHGHGFTQPTVNGGSVDISGSGGHSHTVTGKSGSLAQAGTNRAIFNNSGTGNTNISPGITANTGTHTHTVPAHTHTVSGGKVSDHAGSDAAEAHNNMPPYLAVYVWKRTA